LPKQRQTLLFSATQTKRVEDLIRVSLNDPVMVFADEKSSNATPDQLMQAIFDLLLLLKKLNGNLVVFSM
jgi:superfamily II DNA/RNA helicase